MTQNWYVPTLILMMFIKPSGAQKSSFCPKTIVGSDVPLQWSRDLATLAYGCIAEYIELHCCVQGYTSLLWYQRKPGQHQWELIRTSFQRYTSEGNNQTLVIQAADPDRDKGDYSCVASDKRGNSITNNITLNLIECDNWHEKPLILEPENQETTFKVFPGDNFTVACSAFYGNCDSVFSGCYVDWVQVINDTQIKIIQEGNSSDRVYTQRWNSMSGFKNIGERQTLHINNVGAKDFGHYRCWGYSGYGNSNKDVYLKQKYKTVEAGVIIMSCVLAFLVILVLVSLLIWKKRGLDIRLWFKDSFRRRSPDEAMTYDAAILYTDEDSGFAEDTLERTLTEEYNYTIFTSRDVGYNETYWNAYGKAEEESHCFIFVISPHFFQDALCKNFIHQVISEKFRNFIFVIHTPVSQQEEDRLCTEQPDDRLDIIFRAIKVGRKFEWPAANDQGQQNNNRLNMFWKGLRYELPAKIEGGQNIRRANNIEAQHPQAIDIEAGRNQANQQGDVDQNRNRNRGERNMNSDSGRPLLQSNDSEQVDVCNNDEPVCTVGGIVDDRDNVFHGEDITDQLQLSGESRDTGIGQSV